METHPALPQTTLESLLLLGIVDGVPGPGGGGGLWLWSFGCDPAQPSQRGPLPSIPSSPADGGSGLPHHHPPRPPQLCDPESGSPSSASRPGGGGGGAHQILKDGGGGRLSAGLPQICFPPSPTLSVIDFGAWRAQDTPSRLPVAKKGFEIRERRLSRRRRKLRWTRGCGGGGHEFFSSAPAPSSFILLQRPGH